jgi:hypothetical protein
MEQHGTKIMPLEEAQMGGTWQVLALSMVMGNSSVTLLAISTKAKS